MDTRSVYTVSVLHPDDSFRAPDARSEIQKSLVNFVLEFHIDNAFIYRDQIRENVLVKQYFCDVDVAHLISYDEDLASRLANDPAEVIPLVRPNDTAFARRLLTCRIV